MLHAISEDGRQFLFVNALETLFPTADTSSLLDNALLRRRLPRDVLADVMRRRCVVHVGYYSIFGGWWKETRVDGVLHGKSLAWWPNGNLRWSESFAYGKMHGEHYLYHENGQMNWHHTYDDGKPCGKWGWWNEDGDRVDCCYQLREGVI